MQDVESVDKKDTTFYYEDLILLFQENQGFNKVGHEGYVVLTMLWEVASKFQWPIKIKVYNRDLVVKAGLKSTQELYYIRKKLLKYGFLKDYKKPGQGTREPGIYFLNYNLGSNKT